MARNNTRRTKANTWQTRKESNGHCSLGCDSVGGASFNGTIFSVVRVGEFSNAKLAT